MHHDDVWSCEFHVLRTKAVEPEILASRHWALMLALQLDPQHHDDVGARQGFAHVIGQSDAGSELRKFRRKQGGRAAKYDFRAEFRQKMNVRPRYAAVGDVADNRDP